jgi:uncharacterized protein YkwD
MRRKFQKFSLPTLGVLLIVFLIFSFVFRSNLQQLALKGVDLISAVLPSVLVDMANSDRAEAKLSSLTINPKLVEVAQMKADDMASKSYFAHNTPDGKTPWYWFDKAGYKYKYAGENLAVNFVESEDVEKAWMASPTHKLNILGRNYTEVGIATSTGIYQGKQVIFVVVMFGRPK